MAIRKIIPDTDPLIRRVSQPVENFDGIKQLYDDLVDTMRKHDGIGLAAIQIGVPLNVFVICQSVFFPGDNLSRSRPPDIFINPEVISSNGKMARDLEGCLSSAGSFVYLDRPERIRIRAFTPANEDFYLDLEGLAARCFLHERDHLRGVLMTDVLHSIL